MEKMQLPEPAEEAAVIPIRNRNTIWDTLVVLFGEPAPNRRTLYGRVTKYLTDAGATPEMIMERASKIATMWGPHTLTIVSLEKHWSRFDGLAGQLTDGDVEVAKRQVARDSIRDEIERRRTL